MPVHQIFGAQRPSVRALTEHRPSLWPLCPACWVLEGIQTPGEPRSGGGPLLLVHYGRENTKVLHACSLHPEILAASPAPRF